MIDLHSHILPGLDDGARDLEESLQMAHMAVKSGVSAMVVTPHCMEARADKVLDMFSLLQQALKETGIPLKIYPGMEIFGTRKTVQLLQSGGLFTLNGSRYPLVEFDFVSDGDMETRILGKLLEAGYRPLVAHPERYAYTQQNPELINQWTRMGCLMQINKGSLLGRFGQQSRQLAVALVDRGFATVVASDAHSARVRTPWMADVRELLTKEISPRCARVLLEENPCKILKNEDIFPAEPEWFE